MTDFTSGGYNLEDDSTCHPNGTTDIDSPEPDLGGLADNGGPSETLLPNAGSPAIGAIPSASCTVTVDQREYNRHAGASGAAPSARSSTGRRRVERSTADDDLRERRHGIGLERLPDPEPQVPSPTTGRAKTIAHAVALLTNSDATYGTNPTETVDYTSVATISVAAGTYDESPITSTCRTGHSPLRDRRTRPATTPPPSCSPTDTSDPLFTVGPSPTAPPSPCRTSGSKRPRAPASSLRRRRRRQPQRFADARDRRDQRVHRHRQRRRDLQRRHPDA